MSGRFDLDYASNPHMNKTDPAVEQLQKFIRAFAHEISQPLTAFRGSLELGLRKHGAGKECRENLEEALRHAERMERFVRSVQEWVEAGRTVTNPERLFLNEQVEEAVEDLRPVAETRGVSLSGHREGALPVSADRRRLRQALFNVIGYAVKYCREGDTVEVSLSSSSSSASLVVTQGGSEISPEDIPALPDPFQLLPSGKKTPATSSESRMALSIAGRILEAVGGRLRLENVPGRGNRFFLELPLVSA